MKKILMIALLMGACTLLPQVMADDYSNERAWHMACDLSQFSCDGIDPPQVVVTTNVFLLNWNISGASGMYLEEGTVYVKPAKDEASQFTVLTHEMSHYIDHVHETLREGDGGLCSSEARAFELSDQVARRLGRDDLIVGDDWYEFYPCTAPKGE